jgi:hypothetical protein
MFLKSSKNFNIFQLTSLRAQVGPPSTHHTVDGGIIVAMDTDIVNMEDNGKRKKTRKVSLFF